MIVRFSVLIIIYILHSFYEIHMKINRIYEVIYHFRIAVGIEKMKFFECWDDTLTHKRDLHK